jgi:hypothetical protein
MSRRPIIEIYPKESFLNSIKAGTEISKFTVRISPSKNETYWRFQRRRSDSQRSGSHIPSRHKSAVDTFCSRMSKLNISILTPPSERDCTLASKANTFEYKHSDSIFAKKTRIWPGDTYREDDPSKSYVEISAGDVSRLNPIKALLPLLIMERTPLFRRRT